jgi:hypothetical protein
MRTSENKFPYAFHENTMNYDFAAAQTNQVKFVARLDYL